MMKQIENKNKKMKHNKGEMGQSILFFKKTLPKDNFLRRSWKPTSVFLHGESPWTEEPGRLQSMESQRVGHD